jgi:hypothetical protein
LGALVLLAVVAAAFVATRLVRETRPTGWNLVLLSVDTLRADHLSSYGATFLRTPNMDRLASEGVLYENVSTVAPTTLPSHASLFTGRTPVVHGVRDNVGFYLDERFTTLAAHLKEPGLRHRRLRRAFVLDSRFEARPGFDLYDDDVEAGRRSRLRLRRRAGRRNPRERSPGRLSRRAHAPSSPSFTSIRHSYAVRGRVSRRSGVRRFSRGQLLA